MSVNVKEKPGYTIIQDHGPEGIRCEALVFGDRALEINQGRGNRVIVSPETIPFLEECIKRFKEGAE